jgi:anion-transporting  ArsA/GET3 family ATPase
VELITDRHPLTIVVGSGGVGKTTLAAALGLQSARGGRDTLVMTFDPSLRLKDALGVSEEAREHPMPVDVGKGSARLDASLLDARRTFDRLVVRYAPDEAARRRILENRYYHHLSGRLAGILEYMAVERLWEVASEGSYQQVFLDTPPTRQALDFLEAPSRIVGFLESGALKIALRPWFDQEGRLKATSGWGFLGRGVERFLDDIAGLGLLRDMGEFFQAFEPLYDGFRERALEVEKLLRSERTRFVLVAGAGEERIADTLFFARRLKEAGFRLGPIVVNRVHPAFDAPPEDAGADPCETDGRRLLAWLGERDRRGLDQLRSLLDADQTLLALPLLPDEPTDLASLEGIGRDVLERLKAATDAAVGAAK